MLVGIRHLTQGSSFRGLIDFSWGNRKTGRRWDSKTAKPAAKVQCYPSQTFKNNLEALWEWNVPLCQIEENIQHSDRFCLVSCDNCLWCVPFVLALCVVKKRWCYPRRLHWQEFKLLWHLDCSDNNNLHLSRDLPLSLTLSPSSTEWLCQELALTSMQTIQTISFLLMSNLTSWNRLWSTIERKIQQTTLIRRIL